MKYIPITKGQADFIRELEVNAHLASKNLESAVTAIILSKYENVTYRGVLYGDEPALIISENQQEPHESVPTTTDTAPTILPNES